MAGCCPAGVPESKALGSIAGPAAAPRPGEQSRQCPEPPALGGAELSGRHPIPGSDQDAVMLG